MFRKYLGALLVALVLNLCLSVSVQARGGDPKTAKGAEKVKANIARLGVGSDSRIEVQLRDKTRLKGYVSQITENGFSVVDDRSGQETEIPYAQARQIKGNNLSTGVKVAITVGIILAIAAIAVLVGS